MKNNDNFKKFKDKMITDNESRYGTEIRQKYGDDTINASNTKIKNITEEAMYEAETLRLQIDETLKKAFEQGDPAGELAQKVCKLHKQWICIYWPDGMYSREAHMGLADMYVEDERFRVNYDKLAPGCAKFLCDAIHIYCSK